MQDKIKKLFSHTIIYGLGNYTGKAIGFFLIPVYTRYLTTEDYGILSLVGMLSSILFILFNMGMSSSIFRSYFHHEEEGGRNLVITTASFIILFFSFPLALGAVLFSGTLSNVLLGEQAYKIFIVLACCTTSFNVLLRMPFAIMRAREESKKYAILALARTVLSISLAISLVVGFKKGVLGILISNLVAELFLCLILVPRALKGLPKRFSWHEARGMLSFGLPLVPAGIASFVLNLSDRYFLKHYASLHQVGLYSLGYRFGEIIWLLVWAFQLAWPQFLFSNEKSPNASSLYSRVTTYYIAGMLFITLSVSVFSREIVQIMAHPSFHEAYKVIPIIVLAEVLHGLSFVTAVGINLKRKTFYQPFIIGTAASLNLVLNYLLIPVYGMMGAAIATALSFFVQALLTTLVSLWYYAVHYEYSRILKLVGVGVMIFYATSLVNSGSLTHDVVLKVPLLCLFPVMLLMTKFFLPEELTKAYRFVTDLRNGGFKALSYKNYLS